MHPTGSSSLYCCYSVAKSRLTLGDLGLQHTSLPCLLEFAQGHVEFSSLTRDQTQVPCIGQQGVLSWRSLWVCFFQPHSTACEILVPRTGTELGPSVVKVESPNHWTAREVLSQAPLSPHLDQASTLIYKVVPSAQTIPSTPQTKT